MIEEEKNKQLNDYFDKVDEEMILTKYTDKIYYLRKHMTKEEKIKKGKINFILLTDLSELLFNYTGSLDYDFSNITNIIMENFGYYYAGFTNEYYNKIIPLKDVMGLLEMPPFKKMERAFKLRCKIRKYEDT